MKISKIGFKGYKAFPGGDEEPLQTVELAPLTLIFGKNNSGKSAVTRLPKLLLGGLASSDRNVLPLNVRGEQFGLSFLDLIYRGEFFGRPAFRICGERDQRDLDFLVTLYSRGAFAADEPPLVWSFEMCEPERVSVRDPSQVKGRELFGGLLPKEPTWDPWRKAASELLNGMIHIGPVRTPIASSYSNEVFDRFERDGSGVPNLLRVDGSLSDKVGAWYAENMDGWRLSLKRDSDSFSLRLVREPSFSTNLAHGGEGLQQVLPIVAHQLWRQAQTPQYFIDLVEQPELHLHAAAQAPLADLFIETAVSQSGSTLVETNSEGILLRVQRRVAEGVISPEKVAIYFVENIRNRGSLIRKVEILHTGEMAWWPEGVFEEDFAEVAAIRRAQKRRFGDRPQ